jgi:antitoxin (DNA-binding transcriptional repressor) of toxin-antitoxin stability system
MERIPQHVLRNDVSAVLRRVMAGERRGSVVFAELARRSAHDLGKTGFEEDLARRAEDVPASLLQNDEARP